MVIKVLFVGMGGICRGPSAVGVLRKMVAEAGLQKNIQVDAAATHDYHLGELPDARIGFIARKRHFEVNNIQVRQINLQDFHDYDLILAMDWENLSYLQQMCPRNLGHKLMLLMRFSNDYEEAIVPDPFYGTMDHFFKVYDYLNDACQGVFDVVSRRVKPNAIA